MLLVIVSEMIVVPVPSCANCTSPAPAAWTIIPPTISVPFVTDRAALISESLRSVREVSITSIGVLVWRLETVAEAPMMMMWLSGARPRIVTSSRREGTSPTLQLAGLFQ